MKSFGTTTVDFLKTLNPNFLLPDEVSFLNPYKDEEVVAILSKFYLKYFNDYNKRIFILGINPGRLGAGITGVAFTDPVCLQNDCSIQNSFPKKSELSSTFIYEVIKKYGGVNAFYSSFFLGAVCPIGFTKKGKNINYYDDASLIESSRHFIQKSIMKQIKNGANRNLAICLGEGSNYRYLKEINNQHNFFKEIIPLAHPRFIMQYRRKKMNDYLKAYLKVLKNAASINMI